MSLRTIYFAGGCFWGVQRYLDSLNAIVKTRTGYANANLEITKDINYKLVCTGTTNAVETVEVIYDDSLITLQELLECFFEIIDPTILNRQGNDIGTQYRTGIYTKPDDFNNQKDIIQDSLNSLEKKINKKVVVENLPCHNFCQAEDYHQKYLINNPNGYCHISLSDHLDVINHFNQLADKRKQQA